ncbi:MAG: glycoside hydrolase family 3 C-terminal domain-containing protein [Treponema sp.]|nr:glycoside hydrolase family 3 C-terminal domain-containing protein [Treponema sp.]
MTRIEQERTEEIKSLIDAMSLEEKVGLMLHESMGIPRLGIAPYNWWNEGLHGVARNGNATVFPQAIALAATFNTELAQKEYTVISDEARAKYNEAQKVGDTGQFRGLTYWSPNINIVRDPRWGRAQETFGEDPFLTSQMGVAAVKGLQGDDAQFLKTAACAKHLAVHSGPESTRHTANVCPSKKDLWLTYLPAFKALIDAGVESVMGAYNCVYGEPCNGSHFLISDIVRKRWNFKGYFVSDCWAVRDFHEGHKVTKTAEESAALAINCSCDLNCGCTYHAAIAAVRQGLLSEQKINESVSRLLMTRMKLGMFDSWKKSKWAHLSAKDVDTKQHRMLAKEVAAQSIVLLKNKNNLLPLSDKKHIHKIVVMGPSAANTMALLGNYYGINPHMVTILEGIAGKLDEHPEITVDFHPGVGMYADSKQRGWTVGMAESADVVIACFGLDGMMEGEEGDAVETTRGDRDAIELPQYQLDYLRALHDRGTPVVLILTGGSAIAFPPDVADAVLFAWYGGEEGGNAVADILFGDAVPSGHLPITFYQKTEDLPAFDDYSMQERTYRYMTKEPLFPFGFGLSYTTWRFENLTVAKNAEGSEVLVTVDVLNDGQYDAAQTVQVYVTKQNRTNEEPLCSLCAFTKVTVAKGKRQTVRIKLDKAAFQTVDEDGNTFVEPGEYTVTVSDCAPCSAATRLGATEPIQQTVNF